MTGFVAPTDEQVKAAIRQITTPQLSRAFFEGLQNPLWLEPLIQEGMFDSPPEPEGRDDGLTYERYWPQIAYLDRVAADQPTAVVGVLLKIGQSKNTWIRRAVFSIGAKLPAHEAAQLKDVLRPASSDEFGWRSDPRDALALVISLLTGGERKVGIWLANAMYRPRPATTESNAYFPKPSLTVDEYWYAEAVPQVIRAMEPGDLKTVLRWLVGWEKESGHYRDDGRDTTYLTRESIEVREGTGTHQSAAQVLIEGTRDLAELAVVDDPAATVALLLKVKMELARKIALYVVASTLGREDLSDVQGERLLESAISLLSDEKSQVEPCRIEYAKLAQAVASRDQTRLVGLFRFIDDGPYGSDDDLRKWVGRNDDDNDEEAERQVAAYSDRWKHRWLAAIGSEALPPDLQSTLKELDTRLGSIEDPLEITSRITSWTGPTSPLTKDEMSVMSPAELAAHLENWHASGDHWGPDPSHDGQGRELTALVTGEPNALIGVPGLVDRLRPTYLRAILQGWAQALRADMDIPWDQAEELLRGVLEHDDALTVPQEGEQFDDDGDFRWAKKEAVDVLEELTKPRETPVVRADWLTKYADLIINSAADEVAWQEYDGYQGDSGMDPLTLTLNWEWPRRLRGLVNLMRHGQDSSWYLAAKDALETELARDDRRGASRAVIGESIGTFLVVDETWAKSMIPEWFGGVESLTEPQQIALSTTLALYHYYRGLYEALTPSMLGALGLAEPVAIGFRGHDGPIERIGQWAINGIILGYLTMADPVADKFFAVAPPEVRARAMGHMPWSMTQWDTVDQDLQLRLERLWDERVEHVRSHPEDAKELDEFYWFVKSGKFRPEWWIPRLEDVVELDESFATGHLAIGKELALAAYKYPREALGIAKVLLAPPTSLGGPGWEIRHYAIHFIIAEAMLSDDQALAEDAKALMNRLGSEGDLELAAKVEKAKSREIWARDVPF